MVVLLDDGDDDDNMDLSDRAFAIVSPSLAHHIMRVMSNGIDWVRSRPQLPNLPKDLFISMAKMVNYGPSVSLSPTSYWTLPRQ